MDLLREGIDKGLIALDDDKKYITYVHQRKRRNYARPEESVQAEAFLKLVLVYGYAPERIEQFVPVKIGADTREADIIVYNDDERESAHIVVECKAEDVSEAEFEQAVAQAFSYAATGTVRARYFWVTSRIKDACFEIPEKEPKKRIPVPDIPQYGSHRLARFKYAKGGGSANGQRLFELEAITEDALTRRFRQAHQALWGGGQLDPSQAFDELNKLIFCKMLDEQKPRKKGEPYDFQVFTENGEDRTNKELQKRIRALYAEGRQKDPEVFQEDIRLSREKLRTVVGYLEGVDLGETDLDSRGRAFETFMGSYFRGEFGQFFTPRPIVKFIVGALPITGDSLVLDTSCGSGGFLLHALDKVRRQASEYYPNFETDPAEAKNYDRHWRSFAEKNIFGIEISDRIARTAKMNMILHDDGHTNVIAADGLMSDERLCSLTRNNGFVYERFDFIITNPPFGSQVKRTEQAYMRHYDYARKKADWLNPKSKETARDSQSTEILFIEQCHRFLTEGGYLAIVIPDGILTNSSLQYAREGIEENFRLVAVASMPQTAFQAKGAGVKTSVLFLKKRTSEATKEIHNRKTELQDEIREENDFREQLREIDAEKKRRVKELRGFDNPEGLEGEALSRSAGYREWKKRVGAECQEKIDALREALEREYAERKRSVLGDYPVFMAIAGDIGYDAAGRPTNNNELEGIGEEIARFIEAIEAGGT